MSLLKVLNTYARRVTPAIVFTRHAGTKNSLATPPLMNMVDMRFMRLKWHGNLIKGRWSQRVVFRCSNNNVQTEFCRNHSSKINPESEREKSGDEREQGKVNRVRMMVPSKEKPLSPEIRKTSKLLGQFYSSLAQRDLSGTWKAYNELVRGSGLRYLNRNDYRQMIELVTQSVLNRSENLHRLVTLIDDMKSCEFSMSRYDFHAIMFYMARSSHRLGRRDVEKTLSVFYTMKQLTNMRPNITTYNIILDIAIKSSQFEIVLRLIHDMTQQGLKPGVKIFTSLIHQFATKHELVKLTKTLDSMSKLGINPDSHVWNTVIWAYARTGNLKQAMSIYLKMASRARQLKKSKQNVECTPTLPTYHTLLPANITQEDWESVRNLYGDMKFFDVYPTTESYNVIFCKIVSVLKGNERSKPGDQDRLSIIKDLVDYMFEDMKNCGKVTPAPITFNYLLYLYLMLGDSKKASEILQVMRNNNWKINKLLFSDFTNPPL
ncbi:3841_t:CDS:1 [Acaulospora morrowiae]|uniref:3841_t:CDS:1 n=1 Tax=Acaulospora morrowiae TaxID=94023 RepID=A0A9N9FPF5_9GLOM|nr:3841_t:CDS:1 [Acaulospora morrowiae]